jgi:hypothetical protein
MCYSKEVQLITGCIIILSALYHYSYYSKRYSSSKKPWLKPLLNNLLFFTLCIGTHQLCEFLSLATNNQWVYKLGLLISISSMYFLIRSLEILANRSLSSWLALVFIAIVGLYNLFIAMSFEGFSFYLRHNSGFVWASFWMLLFIYWHICAVQLYKSLKGPSSKKAILLYMLCTVDISFILSLIYVIWGYFRFSVNVCTDSPSIWCTFFVIQSLLIPVFLALLPSLYKRPIKFLSTPIRTTLLLLAISLGIILLLISFLPFFNCLSLKFVFP